MHQQPIGILPQKISECLDRGVGRNVALERRFVLDDWRLQQIINCSVLVLRDGLDGFLLRILATNLGGRQLHVVLGLFQVEPIARSSSKQLQRPERLFHCWAFHDAGTPDAQGPLVRHHGPIIFALRPNGNSCAR